MTTLTSFFLVGLLCLAPAYAKLNRIVGGDYARPGQFKYQISLEVGTQSICGGAVIADNYIITAAHCVVNENGQFSLYRFQVRAGATNLNVDRGVRADVEKVYVLRSYDPQRAINDIAVLKLRNGLGLNSNPNLGKIELPTKNEPSHSGDEAVISGYGLIHVDLAINPLTGQQEEKNGRSDKKLKFAKINIISNQECARKNSYHRVVDGHICGHAVQRGGKREGICSGDSGGPLVHGNTVIGVVSISPLGCVEHQYAAAYTRVSHYIDFVKNAMNNVVTKDMRVREV